MFKLLLIALFVFAVDDTFAFDGTVVEIVADAVVAISSSACALPNIRSLA